jgi:hypothetical protein
MANTIAECKAHLETAYRVLETARQDNVPIKELMIYETRAGACRDALAEASRPPQHDPPCNTVIIV